MDTYMSILRVRGGWGNMVFFSFLVFYSLKPMKIQEQIKFHIIFA